MEVLCRAPLPPAIRPPPNTSSSHHRRRHQAYLNALNLMIFYLPQPSAVMPRRRQKRNGTRKLRRSPRLLLGGKLPLGMSTFTSLHKAVKPIHTTMNTLPPNLNEWFAHPIPQAGVKRSYFATYTVTQPLESGLAHEFCVP